MPMPGKLAARSNAPFGFPRPARLLPATTARTAARARSGEALEHFGAGRPRCDRGIENHGALQRA